MATAAKVVERALARILVRQTEAPLEASEIDDSIDMLNDMMTAWDGSGLALGYTIVTSPSDEVTVPDGALMAIKSNLAIQMADEFGWTVTIQLATSARDSFADLLTQELTPPKTSRPDTMPRGSGNECFNGRRFYPGDSAELLTENDGPILLETGTE